MWQGVQHRLVLEKFPHRRDVDFPSGCWCEFGVAVFVYEDCAYSFSEVGSAADVLPEYDFVIEFFAQGGTACRSNHEFYCCDE